MKAFLCYVALALLLIMVIGTLNERYSGPDLVQQGKIDKGNTTLTQIAESKNDRNGP